MGIGAKEKMQRLGIVPGAKVKFREGLEPEWLRGAVLTVRYSRVKKGKIEVSDKGPFGRRVGRDWYNKFVPAGE